MTEQSKAKTLIEETRELLSKATPGPWISYRDKHVEVASANENADRLKMVAHVYKSGMANGTRYYMPVLECLTLRRVDGRLGF